MFELTTRTMNQISSAEITTSARPITVSNV
jgi:hypothetical protein